MARMPRATIILLVASLSVFAAGQAPADQAEGADSPHELFLTVGKSVVVNSSAPIERVSVGFGEIAEATPVGSQEVLINAKAPGETTMILWEKGGRKLFFEIAVKPSTLTAKGKLEAVRREMKKELPGQNINISFENEMAFVRGSVKDITSADRAMAIAGSLGKTINLLYVDVPPAQEQILLKVQFASVDRNASTELGLNIISTGATNTLGTIGTQQYAPPKLTTGPTTVTLSDALNLFLFRPDLNLAATIKALQAKSLFEILAEPNVLALNGKQASFLAGGEFPYPTLQGGGGGLGAVTIQFREFGVRINFLPVITPRGTIRLEVAPEVSALDFTNGLLFQGFRIPALVVRRVHTDVELQSGQSFAIGGLLDRRMTESLSKIPVLGDIPVLGKLFQSIAKTKSNSELIVIVTPELVRPIPVGQPLPSIEFPGKLMGPDQQPPRTPGIEVTGAQSLQKPTMTIPLEQLLQSLKAAETTMQGGDASKGLADSTWQSSQPSGLGLPAAATPAPSKQ
ncbi:MAG: pilus assembly protein N-terminal domain-containing protein [Bryobacteraceae bacterium]